MVWIKAKKENDSATMNRLNSGLKSFQQELNDVSVRFVKNNPEAFLSVLLIENFVPLKKSPKLTFDLTLNKFLSGVLYAIS